MPQPSELNSFLERARACRVAAERATLGAGDGNRPATAIGRWRFESNRARERTEDAWAGFLRLPGCFPQPVRGSDRDGNARAMGLSWEAVGLSYLSTVVRHQRPLVAVCC